MSHLGQQLREHGVHIRFYNEVIVQRSYLTLFDNLLLATILLQVVLCLLGDDVRSKVALVVTFQFRLEINRQELLIGKNLRTGRLEVMIQDLHTVYLALGKFPSQLHSNVDALVNMRMVDERSVVALDIIA